MKNYWKHIASILGIALYFVAGVAARIYCSTPILNEEVKHESKISSDTICYESHF